MIDVHQGDNLDVLSHCADGAFDLIYIDPPFNTGRVRARTTTRVRRDADGDRRGFGGHRYRTTRGTTHTYADTFDDYPAFLEPRLSAARRVLAPHGSLIVHLDSREVHYIKVALDRIFGRACFQNEIIWAYDYGARSTRRWPAKHDTLLWYTVHPSRYTFRLDRSDRLPYLAPTLVGADKAARGKTPTDTWWHTIVSPTGREKTGYPTQKPLGILRRIVAVHAEPGMMLCDFFAGSGTFGVAADDAGCDVMLVDNNPAAIAVMHQRFSGRRAHFHVPVARSAS